MADPAPAPAAPSSEPTPSECTPAAPAPAAEPTPAPAPSPAPAPNPSAPTKPVKHLILDAAPLLSLAPLRGLADHYLTTPQVLAELRDRRAREHFDNLSLLEGVNVEVRAPDVGSLAKVSAFAKLTGDYSVLSGADLGILALTYAVEVEENGTWRIREAPGKPPQGRPPPSESTPSEAPPPSEAAEESEDVKAEAEAEAEVKNEAPREGELAKEGEAETSQLASDLSQTHLDESPAPADPSTEPAPASAPAPEPTPFSSSTSQPASDPSDSDSSDGEGEWITPSNVAHHKSIDLHHLPAGSSGPSGSGSGAGKKPVVMKAACMTADYAVQNVLLQMGLNLVGSGGKRIRSVKSWVLRCHACFKLCRDQTRKFCPSCGNATLIRTSITTYAASSPSYSSSSPSTSTNPSPQIKIHLRPNFQYHNRGTQYSIPKPKAGSAKGGHAGGSGLILREDDREFVKGVEREKGRIGKEERAMERAAEKGRGGGAAGAWTDPDWLPGLMAPDGKGRRNGGRGLPQVGHGRRNPNEVKKKRK